MAGTGVFAIWPPLSMAAPRPAILALSANHVTLPAAGGATRIAASVRNATTCTWSGEWSDATASTNGKPSYCGYGYSSTKVYDIWTIPANDTYAVRTWVAYVIARGPGGTSNWSHINITELGKQSSWSSLGVMPNSTLNGYLDSCTPSLTTCDYGPINETFPAYGNVAPVDLGDCTFAAAADLIQILTGTQPDPTAIGVEFAGAGGSSNGLNLPQLWTYWEQYGIGGMTISGYSSFYPTQRNVLNGVPQYGALLAWLQFGDGGFIGPIQTSAGYHLAVVDGFTPKGPLVVTWGQTVQMSWDQWNAEAVGLYAIKTN